MAPSPAAQLRRRNQRLARYGLTPARFELMFALQGRACLVCRREVSPRDVHISRDKTCHPDTGTGCPDCIRGLICRGCSGRVGALASLIERDDLDRALNFLQAGLMVVPCEG